MANFDSRIKILREIRSRLAGRDLNSEVSVNCADLEKVLGLAAAMLDHATDKNLTAVELNYLASYGLRRFGLRRKPS